MSTTTDAAESTTLELLRDDRFLVTLLISVVGSFGSNVASPAIPGLTGAFSVSDARAGLIITAYSLAAMVAVPGVAVLADMYGRRVTVIPSIIGFGLAGTLIAAVDTFEAILVLRAVQGLAFAGTAPIALVLVGDLYEGPTAAAAQGIRSSAHGISSIVVPAAAGFVAGIAWQFPFLLYAACIPVAALVYLYLPRYEPRDVHRDETTGLLTSLQSYVQALRAEMTGSGLSILLVGGSALFLVRFVVLTFLPLFAVRVFGASPFLGGALLSIRGIVRILVSPTVGTITARFSRRGALIGGFGTISLGMVLVGLAASIAWVAAAMVVFSIGVAVFFPVLNDAVTATASDEFRSGVVGAFNTLKNVAKTAAPVIFGVVLAVTNYSVMFLVAGVISLVYTVGLTLLYSRPSGS